MSKMIWLWTVLLMLLLGVLALLYSQLTYWRKRKVPHINSYPLMGVFGSVFLRRQSMFEMLQKVYVSCPGASYFGCFDFNTPTIIIKDPEIAKEIGVKSFDYFPNHRGFIEEDFDPVLAKNIFSLKDDRWREMRTTLSPSFTANKMKFLFQVVSQCSIDFVQYLKDHPEITKDLDLKDSFTRYTNDVIATAAFGISVNSMKDRNNDFYVSGLDASSFDGLLKLFKFLSSRFIPKIMRFLGLTFMSKSADKFFKTLLRDTLKMRDEKGIVRPDMIHLLMQARKNDKGIVMTDDDIVAQAFIFFLAGFETSSRLMCFVGHVLSHYPDIQERLREEVDTALEEDDGNVTYETLVKMEYMDMVISETLRLFPPQPFLDRVCGKAYTLPSAMKGCGELTVEPNTNVWIPIFGYHRDPNYFPDPEKFDPERFSDENKNDIKPYTYMPFGYGPRKCIGDRFALMETKILITQLIQNYVLKPSPKTTKEIVFDPTSFSMAPACGFWMVLEKRDR